MGKNIEGANSDDYSETKKFLTDFFGYDYDSFVSIRVSARTYSTLQSHFFLKHRITGIHV